MDDFATTANVNENLTSIQRVGIRVPPFWSADPILWFGQLEGQFLINNITSDDTKYGYVIGNLEARFAAEVKDIIISPPATGKYLKIKTELIARLSSSEQHKIKQLLEREELGDRKPSQFLRRLQDLGGEHITESLLRTLWMGRLPKHLQAILASQINTNLEAASLLADQIMDISPQLRIASTTDNNQLNNLEIQKLTDKLDALQLQISKLQESSNKNISFPKRNFPRNKFRYSRSRSRPQYKHYSRDSSINSDSSIKKENNNYCYYHRTFGSRAHKCIKPCSYVSEN